MEGEEWRVEGKVHGMYYFLVYSGHFLLPLFYSPFISLNPNIGLICLTLYVFVV
jgi:hypothetical protein